MKQKQANINKTLCIIFDLKFSIYMLNFEFWTFSVQEYINRNLLCISLKHWIKKKNVKFLPRLLVSAITSMQATLAFLTVL